MNLVEEGYTVELKGRIVRSHTRPGLDIAINEAEVAKSPFEKDRQSASATATRVVVLATGKEPRR